MIRQREAGYTLAELLVVLALLGMMAIVMADGMRFGGRVWEASARKAEAIETMSGGQTLLRTVLERIVPRDLDPGIPGDPDLFRASPSRMTFLALAPAAIDAGGLSRFDLEVRAVNGRLRACHVMAAAGRPQCQGASHRDNGGASDHLRLCPARSGWIPRLAE